MIPGFVFPVPAAPEQIIIDSDQVDFDLHAHIGSPTEQKQLFVTVTTGTRIIASSYDNFAFEMGSFAPGSLLFLSNFGEILGLAGAGGNSIVAFRVFDRGSGNYGGRWAQLGGGGAAGRGITALENFVGIGGLECHAAYKEKLIPPLIQYNWISGNPGEDGNDGNFGLPLPEPGDPTRVALAPDPQIDQDFVSCGRPEKIGIIPDAEAGIFLTTSPAEEARVGPWIPPYTDPTTFADTSSGGDGGGCIKVTIPTVIHNRGKIYSGGGGGMSGNGHGAYYIDDTPTYSYPGISQNLPFTEGDEPVAWLHMIGSQGGDWGEAGEYSWFTAARQIAIYGSEKYSPGSAGISVFLLSSKLTFTEGSEDSAVLKGPQAAVL